MKKKHMQDDSKQRLMEILMKPLGKKYKMEWERKREREPTPPRARTQPPHKKPRVRVRTPPSRREIDNQNRLQEKSDANIAYLIKRDDEREAARRAEIHLLTRQEIAMNIIILFKYYGLGVIVLKDELEDFITPIGIDKDEIFDAIQYRLNSIPHIIKKIVEILRYVPSHMTHKLLVKTNNIVIKYRNRRNNATDLMNYINNLGGTIQQNHSSWRDNLLYGTYDEFNW